MTCPENQAQSIVNRTRVHKIEKQTNLLCSWDLNSFSTSKVCSSHRHLSKMNVKCCFIKPSLQNIFLYGQRILTRYLLDELATLRENSPDKRSRSLQSFDRPIF